MTRKDQFALLVQTAVITLDHKLVVSQRLKILAEALALPEESIPQDILEGAWSFVQWKSMGYSEPAWMKEYRENIASRVYAEQLEGTRAWWINAQDLLSSSHPQIWHQFIDGRKPIVEMTKKDATEFLDWAREVPGWSDDEPPVRMHDELPS